AAAGAARGRIEGHRRCRLVVRQQALADAQAGAGVIEDGAAAETADGLVIGQDDTGEGRLLPASSRMAPPWSAKPFVIVRSATARLTPPLRSKTRLAALPLMLSLSAPGPSMSRFLVMASSPVASVMVCPLRLGSKAIVSPELALASTARRVPLEPSSAALV